MESSSKQTGLMQREFYLMKELFLQNNLFIS